MSGAKDGEDGQDCEQNAVHRGARQEGSRSEQQAAAASSFPSNAVAIQAWQHPASASRASALATPSSEPLLYHEKQEMLLCGLHALNALLQGPFFNEVELAELAEALDRREREVMAEAGLESSEFLEFVAQGSANVAVDGNFSIQVLTAALDLWGLTIINIDSPAAADAKENPQQEQAFVCHLKAHWFTIRKVAGRWYDFNSFHAAPKFLSDFYLSAFLTTLKSDGWTVFVVRGIFPDPARLGNDRSLGLSRWFTPETASLALLEAEEAERQADAQAAAMQFQDLPQVGSHWQQSGPQPMAWSPSWRIGSHVQEDVNSWKGKGHILGGADSAQPSAPPLAVHDNDTDLDAAIAASLGISYEKEAEEQLLLSEGQGPRLEAGTRSPSVAPGNGSRSEKAPDLMSGEGLQHCMQSQKSDSPIFSHAPPCCNDQKAGYCEEKNPPHAPTPSDSMLAARPPAAPVDPVLPAGSHPEALQGAAAVAPNPDGNVESASTVMAGGGASGSATILRAPGATVEVAVQLPSGKRLQQRFQLEDCVAAVESFVRSHMDRKESFILAERGPFGKALEDGEMTLGDAGLQDKTLLILKIQKRFRDG